MYSTCTQGRAQGSRVWSSSPRECYSIVWDIKLWPCAPCHTKVTHNNKHSQLSTILVQLRSSHKNNFRGVVIKSLALYKTAMYWHRHGTITTKAWSPRGRGYTHVFLYLGRPQHLPFNPKISRISSTQNNIWSFTNSTKYMYPPCCTLTLRKDPNMHRNDP